MSTIGIAGDVTGMWAESVAGITAGLSGLGADRIAGNLQAVSSLMDIMDGLIQSISAAITLMSIWRSRETAEAAAEAAFAALTGRWWQIAAAAGIALTAGTAAYAIATKVRNIRINANNPSETGLTKKMGA